MAFSISSGFSPLQSATNLFSTQASSAVGSSEEMMMDEGCENCGGANANMDGLSLSPAALAAMAEDHMQMGG